MRRRAFLAGLCAGCAGIARASDWAMPPRFARPETASDEGGLWALMDREETRLRRSPFQLRDARLRAYVQDIACRLAEAHCPDVRVYLVRSPLFNASMAPNGMMQVWTGLLLRVDNEAQLAAVIGHEIGHYLQRHSVERLRDARSRAAFGQFLGMFGLVGAIGQVGVLAGMFAYGREHERQADAISVVLMRSAGYDTAEAAKIWENLRLEIEARESGAGTSVLFATHPPAEERQQALAAAAAASAGGERGAQAWQAHTAPYRREWLAEELKRGEHAESVALLTRLIARSPAVADYSFSRGEVYRLRGKDGDLERAAADYQTALAAGDAPPETHRGLGYVQRAKNDFAAARASFVRYLEAAPDAPDFALIKSYLEELPV